MLFDQVYAKTRSFSYDLSTNVNPLGPSSHCIHACNNPKQWASYPSDTYNNLIQGLSLHYGIPTSYFVLGSGIEGLLHDWIVTYLQPHETLVMPAITFQNPRMTAQLKGARVNMIPMHSNMKVDFAKIRQSLTDKVKLIFICHPNNPTGLLEFPEEIVDLAKATRATVLVDEANLEYTNGRSCIEFVNQCPNILVLRSFSKGYGLAGLRVGYAIGAPASLADFSKKRPPFGISGLSCSIALLALADQQHVNRSKIYAEKEKLILQQEFEFLGLYVFPSDSNTLLVRIPDQLNITSAECIERLNAYDCHAVDGVHFALPNQFFRVSPKTHEINKKFTEALNMLLKKY